MYHKFFKRFFDFIFALIGLIALSPLFLLISILLAVSNRGTPFFLQSRGGLNNTIFKIIKFKTMNDKTDRQGKLLPDAERLTVIGSFIRKTSLDEIPQLINIVRGEMSLVGPRPFMSQYLTIYTDFQKRRHEIRPGITGWAQVKGRNNISWQDKFKLDVWYVEHSSFFLDLRIILLTLRRVLLSRDVNQDGSTTSRLFNGKN